jgi:stage V sporulation protein B
MASGAVIMLALPRYLSATEFGDYKIVIALVSILNAVVVTGAVQAVSKFVAAHADRADAIKFKALQMQGLVGGAAAVGVALAAPAVATWYEDPALAGYLRLAALITAAYAFYAVFVGVLNGRKLFLQQAAVDSLYSTAKLLLICGAAVAGLGVAGAISGFALAALIVLVVAAAIVGPRGSAANSPVSFKELLGFQSALIVFLLANQLLMRIDLLLVKKLVADDAEAASAAAGVYAAALDFAYLIFQLVISLTFIVFPLVSEAVARADVAEARTYIGQSLRAAMLASALPAAMFAANAEETLRLVYPPPYAAGAPALGLLAPAMFGFAVITVATAALSSGGTPWVSVLLGTGTCAVAAALDYLLIPEYGLGGAAFATLIAMCLGAVAAIACVTVRYGVVLRWATPLRVIGAAALVGTASYLTPSSHLAAGAGGIVQRLAVVFEFGGYGVAYLALLAAAGEIGARDLRLVGRVLGLR